MTCDILSLKFSHNVDDLYRLRVNGILIGDEYIIYEVIIKNSYGITHEMVNEKVVLDIGANIGCFSILCAYLGARHVIAYEPDPISYRKMLDNISLNNLYGRIMTHNFAIGTKKEQRTLYRHPSSSGMNTFYSMFYGVGVIVNTVTLLEAIGKRHIDILKMDVEGAEVEILPQLLDESNKLYKKVDNVIIEYHIDRGYIKEDLIPIMDKHYEVVKHNGVYFYKRRGLLNVTK